MGGYSVCGYVRYTVSNTGSICARIQALYGCIGDGLRMVCANPENRDFSGFLSKNVEKGPKKAPFWPPKRGKRGVFGGIFGENPPFSGPVPRGCCCFTFGAERGYILINDLF